MQWWPVINAAVLGAALYYVYSKQKQAYEDQRAEEQQFDEAMLRHQEQAQGEQEEHEEQHEERNLLDQHIEEAPMGAPGAPDAAAALAARQAQNEAGPVASWKTREVGAKKAKSLARKEQRRMYFEYLGDQARAQRELDEDYDRQFGDLIEEQRAQRELRNELARQELAEKKRERKDKEEKERQTKAERRAALDAELSAKGYAKLREGDDLSLGVVAGAWLVRGDALVDDMAKALEGGKATWDELVPL